MFLSQDNEQRSAGDKAGPASAGQATPAVPATGQTSVVDIVKSVSPAVVTITAEGVTEADLRAATEATIVG